MTLLAIDTATGISVAVLDDAGRTLASGDSREERLHAELLAPLVEQALADAGVQASDLTAVAVGTGPAPSPGCEPGW